MRRKAITLRDVANRAGVGVSTVSYVLNGHDQHVSLNTRDTVLAAARELKYRPNAIARSMARQKTATIGLIITELQNPLFVPITEGVEEVLRLEGYQILLASANDASSEKQAVEVLRGQQVDGFIFMSLSVRFPTEHLMQLDADDVPFVVINRDLDVEQFNQIQFDDRGAGFSATQHLINLGHRRIATISGPHVQTDGHPQRRSALERHAGWQMALQTAGLPIAAEWIVNGDYTFQGGYTAIHELLARIEHDRQPPTALFIASDMMAMGALRALAELGKRVPQDMAVATIGDPPYAGFTVPPLTTLALPVVEAGRVAARLLVGWLKHGKPIQPQHTILDFQLIVRESCGALLRG